MYTIKPRALDKEEVLEVYAWLREANVVIVRLHRDFSDVYPVAEMLKSKFPRQIDLLNYPKRNRVALKIQNWETFNFKLLNKFNMALGREFMEELAKGTHGAAEVLVLELIRLLKRQDQAKGRKAASEHKMVASKKTVIPKDEPKAVALDKGDQFPEDGDKVQTVLVSNNVGEDVIQIPTKMIRYSRYEQLSREAQAKDEMIGVYERRLVLLEAMVKSKADSMEKLLNIIDQMPVANANCS